jgi:hypothetical protein
MTDTLSELVKVARQADCTNEVGSINISAGTGPVKTGISPVETFEKCPLLILFLSIKTKISRLS